MNKKPQNKDDLRAAIVVRREGYLKDHQIRTQPLIQLASWCLGFPDKSRGLSMYWDVVHWLLGPGKNLGREGSYSRADPAKFRRLYLSALLTCAELGEDVLLPDATGWGDIPKVVRVRNRYLRKVTVGRGAATVVSTSGGHLAPSRTNHGPSLWRYSREYLRTFRSVQNQVPNAWEGTDPEIVKAVGPLWWVFLLDSGPWLETLAEMRRVFERYRDIVASDIYGNNDWLVQADLFNYAVLDLLRTPEVGEWGADPPIVNVQTETYTRMWSAAFKSGSRASLETMFRNEAPKLIDHLLYMNQVFVSTRALRGTLVSADSLLEPS